MLSTSLTAEHFCGKAAYHVGMGGAYFSKFCYLLDLLSELDRLCLLSVSWW